MSGPEAAEPCGTRLFLVRHGEPEEWVRGRCCGRLDPGLSAAGVEQARRAGFALAPAGIDAVYSSPSRRALDTARAIAGGVAAEVRLDERLREIDFGGFEGLTYEQAEQRHPEAFAVWVASPGSVRFPGGESWDDLRARVLPAIEAICAREEGRRVAIVAHAGVVRVVLADVLGSSPDACFRIAVDHGSITEVRRFGRAWTLRSTNRT